MVPNSAYFEGLILFLDKTYIFLSKIIVVEILSIFKNKLKYIPSLVIHQFVWEVSEIPMRIVPVLDSYALWC